MTTHKGHSARTSTASASSASTLLKTPESPSTKMAVSEEALHQPLLPGHVRLFRLRAAQETCSWKTVFSTAWLTPAVNLEIASFPVAQAPTFHAISCTLAPSDRTVAVRINGKKRHLPSALDAVLDALETALRESPAPRGGFLGGWLWLEQLCAAPTDKDPSARRAAVLRRAEGTVVFLSPEGMDASPYHFAVDAGARSRKLGAPMNDYGHHDYRDEPSPGDDGVDDALLEGLAALLGAQPWFTDRNAAAAVACSRLPVRLLYGSVFLSWNRIVAVAGVLREAVRAGAAASPRGSLAPAWPGSKQSVRWWVGRIYAENRKAAECLQVLAYASRMRPGEVDEQAMMGMVDEILKFSGVVRRARDSGDRIVIT